MVSNKDCSQVQKGEVQQTKKQIKVRLKSNFEESTVFANMYRGQGKEEEESLKAWSFFLPLQVKDLKKNKG